MNTIFLVKRHPDASPEYRFGVREVTSQMDSTGLLRRFNGTPRDAVASKMRSAQRALAEAQADVDALQMLLDDPEWLRQQTHRL